MKFPRNVTLFTQRTETFDAVSALIHEIAPRMQVKRRFSTEGAVDISYNSHNPEHKKFAQILAKKITKWSGEPVRAKESCVSGVWIEIPEDLVNKKTMQLWKNRR